MLRLKLIHVSKRGPWLHSVIMRQLLHDMGRLSASLVLVKGILRWPMDSSHKGARNAEFWCFFVVTVHKQSSCWWFKTRWRSCDVMYDFPILFATEYVQRTVRENCTGGSLVSHRICTLFCCALFLWFYYLSIVASCDVFTIFLPGAFTATGTIVWLPQCQWCNPEGHG